MRPGRALDSLCLALLLTAIGICDEPPWLGINTRIETKGFSAYGVQCGMSFDRLMELLGANWTTDVITQDIEYAVQDHAGRHLVLSIANKESGRPIQSIAIFPVDDTLSIELDGKQVVFPDDSIQSIEVRIGRKAQEIESRCFEFKFRDQILILTFGGKNGELDSVDLAKP